MDGVELELETRLDVGYHGADDVINVPRRERCEEWLPCRIDIGQHHLLTYREKETDERTYPRNKQQQQQHCCDLRVVTCDTPLRTGHMLDPLGLEKLVQLFALLLKRTQLFESDGPLVALARPIVAGEQQQ